VDAERAGHSQEWQAGRQLRYMKPRWLKPAHYALIAAVVSGGLAATVHSIETLDASRFAFQWFLLLVIMLVSGTFAVKIPALNARLSISETFVFIMVLLFGTGPATLAAAVDGLTGSITRRHWNIRQFAFNVAEPALSVWISSSVYYWLAGVPPLSIAKSELGTIGLPVLALASLYFLLNSTLNALAVATESGTSPMVLWRKYFLWVSLNFFGGASIAMLVTVNSPDVSLKTMAFIAPLLLVSYLTFKSSMGRVEDENTHLGQLNKLYLRIVETLAMAIDAKDQVTHGHIRRVQSAAVELASRLGVADPAEIRAIKAAALLHDMGKIAVPEHILNKPGKLTPAEFERMKLHAPLGADILAAVDFPYPVVPIVRHHHENWDGTGYPDGLKGEDIPLAARILSVVDCYDALTSHRPYRRALSREDSLTIIMERRGTMYDPRVVDAFLTVDIEIEPDEPVALPELFDRIAASVRESRTWVDSSDVTQFQARLNAREAVLQLYKCLALLPRDAALSHTAEAIARHVRQMAPASLVALYWVDQPADEIVLAWASGFGDTLVGGHRMRMGRGASGWVAATRESIVNADPALDVAGRADGLVPRLKSTLAVPLVNDDVVVGTLTVYSTERNAFAEEHRQLLETVSTGIADAFARAISWSGTDQAPADGLQASADMALQRRLLESGQLWTGDLQRSLGVLCLRVDGDESLMSAASVAATQATRIADLVFRTSDQELVVLMPHCDRSAGELVAERLGAVVPLENPTNGGGSVQVGFACAPFDGDTLDVLLDSARRRIASGAENHADRAPASVPKEGSS
jgi:putative nucleotidyltransferase with HDIG domain